MESFAYYLLQMFLYTFFKLDTAAKYIVFLYDLAWIFILAKPSQYLTAHITGVLANY